MHNADTRDTEGRKTFFPFVPEHHLIPGHIPQDSWYWPYQYYKVKYTSCIGLNELNNQLFIIFRKNLVLGAAVIMQFHFIMFHQKVGML